MIKINLLPYRASKKRELGKQWIVLFSLTLAGTLLGNFFWMSETDKAVAALNARIKKTEEELATLNKIISEVKDIRQQKEAMTQKLDVLKKLRDGRTGPVRMLDELATVIPPNVWLQSMKEGGGRITFEGGARSHEDVANFMKKLKSSNLFSAPELRTARAEGDGNSVRFSISCAVKYSA